MITYVDSSVLMRLVLGEGNPLAGWELLKPISSELIRVECLRAIERALIGATGSIAAALPVRRGAVLRILEAFELVALSRVILERAADPFPVHVATLDALHLATAVFLREEHADLQFATHDAKLALAARSIGFEVVGAP